MLYLVVVVVDYCGMLLCCIGFRRVLVCVVVVVDCIVFVGCCMVLLCLLVVLGCGFVVVVFCIGLRNGSTCRTMCCCILLLGIVLLCVCWVYLNYKVCIGLFVVLVVVFFGCVCCCCAC